MHHSASPPFCQSFLETGEERDPSFPNATRGFGFGQTIVRRAGWGIVHALLGSQGSKSRDENWTAWIGQSDPDVKDHVLVPLGLMSSAILRSAFVEPDPVVRSSIWEPLLVFLTS